MAAKPSRSSSTRSRVWSRAPDRAPRPSPRWRRRSPPAQPRPATPLGAGAGAPHRETPSSST
eukprot:6573495-Pyramimonas_sp.AAC.2